MTRRVAALFWPYRGQLALLAVVIIVTSGLSVWSMMLIKPVFDQALFCPRNCPNLPLLFWLTGVMIAIPILTGVLEVCRPYLANTLGQRVIQGLREALYNHLQRMPLRFFTETKIGEIQSRLVNDVGGLELVVTETVALILMTIVLLISTIGAMLVLSWQLTAVSLVVMPLFIWLTNRVGRARRAVGSSTQQMMAELSAVSEETLSVAGVLLSRSFGRRQQEIARFRTISTRLADLQIRKQMIGQGFFMSLRMFFAVTPVLAYLVTGLLLARGSETHLSAGTLVAFSALQLQLLPPVGSLSQMVVQVQSSMALFERIFAYLDMAPDITDAPDAIDLPVERARGAISLRNVTFRYPSVNPSVASSCNALTDITLDIEPGQFAAIVGASGSGKTTLFYLLMRLYDVAGGAVLIDGLDVRRIRLDSLAAMIGIVTQEPYLFHGSVRENLRYGDPYASDEQLEAAARVAAIHDRILELDEGYDTPVGERGYRMSGGEKQRLAIARTLLKDPSILILDEATSALDTTNDRLVRQALVPLMAGRTTVAIAHRLSTILTADVIFVLDRGRLVERGTHTELFDRGGVYAGLYRHQFAEATVNRL